MLPQIQMMIKKKFKLMRSMISQHRPLKIKANSNTIKFGQSSQSNKLSLDVIDSTNISNPLIKLKTKKYQCLEKNGFKERLI